MSRSVCSKTSRSLVAIGGPGPVLVPATGTLDVTFVIAEAGVLDKLTIDAATQDIDVIGIVYDNKNLKTGVLPVAMFQRDQTRGPSFGIPVLVAHELTVTLDNPSVAAVAANLGWSVR